MPTQLICRHCGGPVVIEPIGDHGYYSRPGRIIPATCDVYALRWQRGDSRYAAQAHLPGYEFARQGWRVIRVLGPQRIITERPDDVVIPASPVRGEDGRLQPLPPPPPTTCPNCGAQMVLRPERYGAPSWHCPNSSSRTEELEGCPECTESVAEVTGLHGLN